MRRVRRRPKGQQDSRPKGGRWSRRAKVNPRDPLTISVKFRGGPECWYEIHARGSMGRFPGYVSLHDAMHEIMLGQEWHHRNSE